MSRSLLLAIVERKFLAVHGDAQVMERRFVSGTGYAARIKELEADRARLRGDREAGVLTLKTPHGSATASAHCARRSRNCGNFRSVRPSSE
jgi:hypothetical protein